jgi:hypothetical protein
MQMIGHEAEGVEQERVACGDRKQVIQCRVAKREVSEKWIAVVTADGDEVDSITEVILWGKADIFSVEWHRVEINKRGCREK